MGEPAHNRLPVGTVRVRTFSRTRDQRAFVKIAEPNVWRLRAHFIWEQNFGPIPKGFGVHHRDRNKLNDNSANLELVTKAEHLAEHRSEFEHARTAASSVARRRIRWSTSSATKRTGRHPADCPCPIHGGAQ
jgi:hypothetical protein